VILDEAPLTAREDQGLLVLELPGIQCWCDPPRGEARLYLHDPEAIPVEHLTRWLIVAALFQLAQERGWIGLHAAAVVIDGRAVLLPGPSGSGKSTIFHDALASGHLGLSEDLVWVWEEQEGFRVGAFRRGDDPAPLRSGPDEAGIAAVVLPSIHDLPASTLRSIPPAAAVGKVLAQASILGGGASAARRFKLLVRLAARVECRMLEAGRDRGSTIALLHGLVRQSASEGAGQGRGGRSEDSNEPARSEAR
jgi:hypothetical protein